MMIGPEKTRASYILCAGGTCDADRHTETGSEVEMDLLNSNDEHQQSNGNTTCFTERRNNEDIGVSNADSLLHNCASQGSGDGSQLSSGITQGFGVNSQLPSGITQGSGVTLNHPVELHNVPLLALNHPVVLHNVPVLTLNRPAVLHNVPLLALNHPAVLYKVR
ncbi:uncharacterized protein LOC117316209 [Pecten maximus]|uniref:uncharacterized protein LOC117316209 n=1 Tax=Pecten maximus TaxID=6579 RepID=UPI001458C469|nr:uncharacterized protein LOC117316209 [Pecten maximus]